MAKKRSKRLDKLLTDSTAATSLALSNNGVIGSRSLALAFSGLFSIVVFYPGM